MQVANKLRGHDQYQCAKSIAAIYAGQMKALSILASTAASALESASLYAQVRRAEENYRSIFENAADGVFRATPDGSRFVSVNPALARMFGYATSTEMVDSVIDVLAELGFEEEGRGEARKIVSEGGVLEGLEQKVRRRDGTISGSRSVRAGFPSPKASLHISTASCRTSASANKWKRHCAPARSNCGNRRSSRQSDNWPAASRTISIISDRDRRLFRSDPEAHAGREPVPHERRRDKKSQRQGRRIDPPTTRL